MWHVIVEFFMLKQLRDFIIPGAACCCLIEINWIMMTSSNGNIFRVTGPLFGEFTGPGEFLTQRPVTRSFDVYFDLRLNKRLCKQSWGWWFETLLCPLWRHSNGLWSNVLHRQWGLPECIWCDEVCIMIIVMPYDITDWGHHYWSR